MITQLEYNLAKQRIRDMKVEIVLLNHLFQTVGEITGVTTSQPTFTINSESDIRRTCSITITPIDSTFDIAKGNKIWLDKYIQIKIGIIDVYSKDYVFTNMGIYMINNPNRVYSSSENSLTFQGLDLMATLTGLRKGALEGVTYLVPQGSNVKMAICALLEKHGFTKYIVEECPIEVPNDLKFEVGKSAYDVLKALRDILPNYQMYFDVDGVFHYCKIPSGKNEQVMVKDDVWKENLIGYNKATDFESLKNSIEVFGKTHNIKNYGGKATVSGNTYNISLSEISELRRNIKIGFNTDVDLGSAKQLAVTTTKTKVVNNQVTTETHIDKYPILRYNREVPTFKSEDTYYVVKFVYGENHFEFVKTQNVSNPPIAMISNDTYIVQSANYTKYTNGMEVTFRTPTSGCDTVYTPYLQINSLTKIQIHNTVKLRNDTTYTLKYIEAQADDTLKYFQFLGEVTPYAKVVESNEESPFYVNGTVGVINQVLSGGDYDNIYSSDLALERANWELYQRCRLKDSVTLTCVPIYWLDVNLLIEITLPNKYGLEEKELYLIKSVNIGETQTITMMKYYPYYNE